MRYTIRYYPAAAADALSKEQYRDIGTNFPYAMLHDVTTLNNVVAEPNLQMEVSRSGQLTFTIYPQHPLYNDVKSSFLWQAAVFAGSSCIWGGHPIQKTCDMYGGVTVTCEGIMGFLSDVYMPPFSKKDILPSSLLRYFISRYNTENEAVTDNALEQAISRMRRIEPYDVTDFDWNSTGEERHITRYTDKALPVMDALQTRLIDYYGGCLQIGMSTSKEYLWWLSWNKFDKTDPAQQCRQTAEIGVNLEELSYEEDWTDFATALVPVDENGNCIVSPLSDDATLRVVPDGTPAAFEDYYCSGIKAGSVLFYNKYLRRNYGLIAKEYADFTGDEWQEQVVGRMLLEAMRLKMPTRIIEAKVIDMSMIESMAERFQVGKFIHVISDAHHINEWMLIQKLEISLDNPAENTVTLTTDTEG